MSDETKNEAGEETVILARLSDPVEAGALRELLESEGISVATPGLTHRGMLGIAGGFVDIVVRVPEKDRARAKELYDGLHAASDEAPQTTDETPRTDRLRRIAMFAALWLPLGGGHFYARQHRAAFFLLGAQILTVGLAFAFPPFWYAVPGVMLADAIGSVLTIGAMQRGEPPSALARFAPLLAIVALLAVLGVRLFAPGVLAGSAMRSACTVAARCGGEESASACIDRAAGRAFEGHGAETTARDCADCLDERTCDEVYEECGACRGLVTLPLPVEDTTQGPAGTRPGDLLLPIPDLFAQPDEGDGLTPEDVQRLFQALPETPPPPATP